MTFLDYIGVGVFVVSRHYDLSNVAALGFIVAASVLAGFLFALVVIVNGRRNDLPKS